MAIEASLTGHLVLSTLHTNSAAETVTRLLDMGLDAFNFADSLLAIQAQRLVRKLCSQCVTSRPATAAEVDELLGPSPRLRRRPGAAAARCPAGALAAPLRPRRPAHDDELPGLRGLRPNRLPRAYRHP
jgi:type II secretory ATPase GspE/PulE/Tfp pilus assembly ATPase PilB-like protein